MRHKTLKLLAAMAVLVPVAACGGSSSNGETGAAGSNTPQGKVTLQFLSLAWQAPTLAANKKIVADWNAAHPNIQVQYIQGDWDSVHDKLVTQFQGGTAPDIVHDEAADISGFAQQGYLADLSSMMPADLKSGIPDDVWKTVQSDKGTFAVPFLLQAYVPFANKALLQQAGIQLPTISSPWTWDQFQQAAKKLTTGGHYGLGWGLKQPTATMMTLGLNFNGQYFYTDNGQTKLQFNAAEQQVPQRIHAMAYDDKSIDPTSLTLSGSDVLPAFFAGKDAMVVEGSYAAQEMVEKAPKSFQWVMLPPLKGDSQKQAADPQTLSVTAQSKHKQQAMQFIDYFMSAKNLAAVAEGDWLIPTTQAAGKQVLADTGGKNGWDVIVNARDSQSNAAFQTVASYPQWKDQVATPNFQKYLSNQEDLKTLGQQLTSGWQQIAASAG